jgi:uncharacterized membrane protein YgcG
MLSVIAAAVLAVALPPLGPSHVVDQAGIISPDDQADIAGRIQRVQARDRVDLAVLTLPAIDEAPQVVAQRAYVSWNLSQRGVLILISMSPKKIHVQPGPGLNGMPTSNWDQVFQVMKPHAAAGNFSEAIRQGLNVAVGRLHAYDQSMAAASAVPRQVQPQLPPAVLSPPPLPSGAQPVSAPARAVAQPQPEMNEPSFISVHPFLFALIFVLLAVAIVVVIRRALRQPRVSYDIETDPELTPVPPSRKEYRQRSQRRSFEMMYGAPQRVAPTSQVVVQQSAGGGGGGGSSDFAAGMMVNELLHDHQRASQAPTPSYNPPPPAPRSTPLAPPPPPPSPSFNSGSGGSFDSGDFSSGGGGDFGGGSSSSDFSSGGGGDFGGGGGGDFSSGSGGDF